MKTKAAVAFKAESPLEILEVDLDGPKDDEVLVEIKATESVILMNTHCPGQILKESSHVF